MGMLMPLAANNGVGFVVVFYVAHIAVVVEDVAAVADAVVDFADVVEDANTRGKLLLPMLTTP